MLALNVNKHTEKKGKLTYMSWVWAWAEALKADPAATFEVMRFGDSCVMWVGETAMVWVTVTMFGKPMTCQLPVMDNRNEAIRKPDAFAVNTAIMRCMTKALALHGLGLYIYAGEDMPDGYEEALPEYPKTDFEANLPKWSEIIASGKKSADDILSVLSKKYTLTQEQIQGVKNAGA